MKSDTNLSKTLVNSYRVAHYRVVITNMISFIIKIKKKSADLLLLMEKHHQYTAVYITAYNSRGKQTDRNINMRSQKALLGEIIRTGLPYWDGFGEDPTGAWKSEPSFLVLGMTQEEAEALGRKYSQNAIVWVEGDGLPGLIFLR